MLPALVKLPVHLVYPAPFALVGAESTGAPVPVRVFKDVVIVGVVAAVLLAGVLVARRRLRRPASAQRTP